jgi:phage terminase large subunit-like protein
MLEGLQYLKPSEFAKFYFDFNAYDYQKNALDSDGINVVLVWGRQTGKSTLTAIRALYEALMHDNYTILVLAPTQRQSSRLFKKIKQFINISAQKLPQLKLTETIERETQTLFEFSNGSEILSLPIGEDASNIRGFTAHMVIIDECGELKKAEIWSAINPMTMTTHGKQWLIGTFRGTDNRFYDIWKDPKKFEFLVYEATSYDNPNADQKQIERDRQTMSLSMWNQEYMNIPMEEADAFFPSSLVEKIISNYDAHETPLPNHVYYLGVDPAGEGIDDTCFCIVGKSSLWTFVAKFIETKRQTLPQIELNIRLLHQLWGFRKIWIDSTGGRNLHEFLVKDGIPAEGMVFSLKTKQEVFQNLKQMMQGKSFTMYNNEKARKQLLDMRYDFAKVGSEANIRIFSGQSRSHGLPGGDDYPTALALAMWGIKIPEVPVVFARTKSLMAGVEI